MPHRLAVITSHPIQYYAPLFRRLAARAELNFRVFYTWNGGAGQPAHDPGFGRAVAWDIPLLDGYDHTFVPNVSSAPGTHNFRGLDNPELVERVLAWRADAVLIFGWAWKSHLQALWRLHGRIPVLFRGDSTLVDEQPGARRWLRRHWLRRVYRKVDVALYVGALNRAYFRAHGLAERQLAWVPHAIENERFADPDGRHAADANTWRTHLGIGAAAVVFLFAGKLEPKKDPGLLVEAFLRLDDESFHLVLAGSGPLESNLRARVAGHPRIHFVGFQNQSRMPVTYRLADIVVLPSRGPGETWGLAVNEAMASARPVIVSDRVGCAPDLVTKDSIGRVMQAGSIESLQSAMREVADDSGLRTAMREEAKTAIRPWSHDAQADRIVAAVRATVE